MQLFIHARNATFHSRDEGAEYTNPEAALSLGVGSAVVMLGDEINQGARNAVVEISVEEESGKQILRSVVALSVSPLLPTSAS